MSRFLILSIGSQTLGADAIGCLSVITNWLNWFFKDYCLTTRRGSPCKSLIARVILLKGYQMSMAACKISGGTPSRTRLIMLNIILILKAKLKLAWQSGPSTGFMPIRQEGYGQVWITRPIGSLAYCCKRGI